MKRFTTIDQLATAGWLSFTLATVLQLMYVITGYRPWSGIAYMVLLLAYLTTSYALYRSQRRQETRR